MLLFKKVGGLMGRVNWGFCASKSENRRSLCGVFGLVAKLKISLFLLADCHRIPP